MATTTLYGIKNCDTIRKARKWLTDQAIEFEFHDYRTDGLSRDQLQSWCDELGWEALLNKRGTTFRQLSDAQKKSLDEASAIDLMLQSPAMIKRPLLVHHQQKILGFKPADYQSFFEAN